MTDDLTKQLAQLKQAHESGLLDAETYQAIVAKLLAADVPAQQSGSGASAQSGGTAAGAGGVAVGGNIHGNVYLGERPTDAAGSLAIYRRVFVSTGRQLPLRGVDVQASDPGGGRKQLDLDRVYIGLNTTSQRPLTPAEMAAAAKERTRRTVEGGPEESRPLAALEAVIANRQAVLLGDPGSGKSTFLNHLGLCLALHGQDREGDWLERLEGWPANDGDLIPIAVVLRDFARWLAERTGPAMPSHLWQFICSRLAAQNLDFAAQPLHAALEAGRAILLLDGLDEIPASQERTRMRDAIHVFARRYGQCRLLVTCRTLSYQEAEWKIPGLPSFALAAFDEEKISNFVTGWYAELARSGGLEQAKADRLDRQLHDALQRPDLAQLAANPLLLTVMALVHTDREQLPDARALLYEQTIEILLSRWDQNKSGAEQETPRLRQLLEEAGRGDVDLKGVLWRLTFQAHKTGGAAGDGEALADIGELALQKALAELHPTGSRDWANSLIQTMKLRAGLLLERLPGVFTLPHRTFQEYMAGAFLASQNNFAEEAAKLVQPGDLWRQVILLAVGRLVYLGGETGRPLALVGELCPDTPDTSDLGWRRVWLAGEVLHEIRLNRVQDSALGRDLLAKVRGRLAALLAAGALTPVERAEAGDVLASLGDPRFRPDAWHLPAEALLGFVEIPAGPFLMGSDKRKNPQAQERETPQHRLELPAFYMARYPVTVTQWRAFVEASGHTPEISRSLEGPANRPVRWVTWHEALAYCRWLTEALRGWSGTPPRLAALLRDGWAISLPSEAEWEKAARGGVEMTNPGRIYPWGDEPGAERANYSATGIGTTSAVGAFPAGASPYGLLEMAGNVWEWTRSLWGEDWQKPSFGYPYRAEDGREALDASNQVLRVLRGGAYYESADGIRASARLRNFPYGRFNYYGFRLVCVPISRVAGSGF